MKLADTAANQESKTGHTASPLAHACAAIMTVITKDTAQKKTSTFITRISSSVEMRPSLLRSRRRKVILLLRWWSVCKSTANRDRDGESETDKERSKPIANLSQLLLQPPNHRLHAGGEALRHVRDHQVPPRLSLQLADVLEVSSSSAPIGCFS